MDDQYWLTQYVEQRSQRDFARLVERHTAMVYSAALRQVKDPHLAIAALRNAIGNAG